MKTGNRRPKPRNLKGPTAGIKRQLAQGLKSFKKLMANASGPTNRKQNWMTPRAVRASYLLGFHGSHTAHQGPKECARRVRQMQEHKCINPETWKGWLPGYFTYETSQEA
jgi:hypothetical protein